MFDRLSWPGGKVGPSQIPQLTEGSENLVRWGWKDMWDIQQGGAWKGMWGLSIVAWKGMWGIQLGGA